MLEHPVDLAALTRPEQIASYFGGGPDRVLSVFSGPGTGRASLVEQLQACSQTLSLILTLTLTF